MPRSGEQTSKAEEAQGQNVLPNERVAIVKHDSDSNRCD